MKKKVLIFAVFSAFLFNVRSQTTNLPPLDTMPHIHFGISTGIDNYAGMLGAGLEFRPYRTLFIRIGAGIGGWGYKFSGGVKYETPNQKNWGFGVFYTQSSGLMDFRTKLEVYLDSTSTLLVNREVTLDLLKAGSLNFTVSRNWISSRKKNKFYLEFGYAVPLTTEPYIIKDGSRLSGTSLRVMEIEQPGGLIISLGYFFAMD